VRIAASRVRTMMRAARRCGLGAVVPVVADGRRLPVVDAQFDRVLLDAPCTGLGVLRRRPDARWRVEPHDAPALADLQRELLVAAARFVSGEIGKNNRGRPEYRRVDHAVVAGGIAAVADGDAAAVDVQAAFAKIDARAAERGPR
jgi:hypothetical protein